MTDVPGVLLQQMEQDSLQRRRVVAVPAFAGLPDICQVVGLDDGPAPLGLRGESRDQPVERRS